MVIIDREKYFRYYKEFYSYYVDIDLVYFGFSYENCFVRKLQSMINNAISNILNTVNNDVNHCDCNKSYGKMLYDILKAVFDSYSNLYSKIVSRNGGRNYIFKNNPLLSYSYELIFNAFNELIPLIQLYTNYSILIYNECVLYEIDITQDDQGKIEVCVNLEVCLEEAYLPHLILQNKKYDLIISSISLHLVNNLQEVIFYYKSLSKENGIFLSSIIGGNSLFNLRDEYMKFDMYYYTYSKYYMRILPMLTPSGCLNLFSNFHFSNLSIFTYRLLFQYAESNKLILDTWLCTDFLSNNAIYDRVQYMQDFMRHFFLKETMYEIFLIESL